MERLSLFKVDLSQTFSLLEIQGPDAPFFLNALTSQAIPEEGKANRHALLEKNSRVIAIFFVFNLGDKLTLLIPKDLVKEVHTKLEQFHFSEEIQFYQPKPTLFYLGGSELPQALRVAKEDLYYFNTQKVHGQFIFSLPITGDEGILIIDASKEWTERWSGAHVISESDFSMLCAKAGYLEQGKDFTPSQMLLEVNPLDDLVSTAKGCYPGQETVARTMNRGQVQKKVMAVSHKEPNIPTKLYYKGKEILQIQRTLTENDDFISIAFIRREGWALGRVKLELEPGDYKKRIEVEIMDLPIYTSKNKRSKAKELLDSGMQSYHDDHFTKAKEKLYQAIGLLPKYTAAYETLAVIEEREGNTENAIELNKKYATLAPTAVMARTNLSRLYMKKGLIEQAEEEQKKATLLGYKVNTKSQQELASLKKQADAERARKLKLFQEVLEIDPDDEIANFGIGKIMFDTDQSQAAIPPLKKVISLNKNYSAAYDLLTRALIKEKKHIDAKFFLEEGILTAKRQGDLTPLKSMESKLRDIQKMNIEP